MRQGHLFVVSGPSGAGKGTVLKRLINEYDNLEYSISATTRHSRKGEVDGKDYFFLTENDFFKLVDDDRFIEWAKVHNNYYGTPKDYVLEMIEKGKDIILEIDIQGAKQVCESYPEAIFVFLAPPSLEELARRLDQRGSENRHTKEVRLNNAREEMKERENYDYEIINDKIDQAVLKLKSIIIAENCKIK
ncbi:guanylate kinase [Iocasia frigidifontis]|uniref:Guanylate kinase n=1 Tax=Iocasia fonsfrigidae TaxID=2682810 RepID=A0A8A7K8L7_9FIRM|nr:guanylate kinase [Iocasia fonsfrigidae]QTL98143.1 guanylate kinase [Iocasia fonsfrigidae]